MILLELKLCDGPDREAWWGLRKEMKDERSHWTGLNIFAGGSNLRTPCRDLLSNFSSQSSLQSPGPTSHHSQDSLNLQLRSQHHGDSQESDLQLRRQTFSRPMFSPLPSLRNEEGTVRRSPSPISRAALGSPVKSKILRKSSSSSRFRADSPLETTERSQSASPLPSDTASNLRPSQSHSSLRRNSTDQELKKSAEFSKKKFSFHFMGHSTHH